MGSYQERLADYCEDQIEYITPLGGGQEYIMDPHQQDAMELATIALLTNEKAFSIVHSCGSGKTLLEGNLLTASQRAKNDLGMQNTQDLITTTQRALIHTIRADLEKLGLDVGIWGDSKRILDRPVILASVHALQKNDTSGRLKSLLNPDNVPLIIGDEADQFLTKQRIALIKKFGHSHRIGLTATPTWPDGRDIEDVWGEKIHELKLKDGILNRVNIPPLFYIFEANIDDAHIKTYQGEYDRKTLSGALKEAEIQKAVPEVYKNLIPEKARKDYPTIVFVPSVNLVKATVETLKREFGNSVSIRAWTGDCTTSFTLSNDIRDFNEGKVDILVLCEMGGRGVNLPRARCLIDAYPTLSSTKLEQRHGRVLRRIRDESGLAKQGFKKPFALIAQIIPRSNKYRPCLLPDILDCWPNFAQGRLLGLQVSGEGGFKEGDVGAPILEEVRLIREYILSRNPLIYVKKVEEIDIFKEIELRANLPKANADGFIIIDNQRFATIGRWMDVLGVTDTKLTPRLKGEKSIKGVDMVGRIRDFYAEEITMKASEDLREDIPQVEDDGFIYKDGKQYGSLQCIGQLLNISRQTISLRLKTAQNINTIMGKNANCVVINYYDVDDIRNLCADLLKEMPQANDDDSIEIDGEIYRTAKGWIKILKIKGQTVYNKLRSVKYIEGKDRLGHVCKFYSTSSVDENIKIRKLDDSIRADENGFFEIDGERYGIIAAWAKLYGRAKKGFLLRLKKYDFVTARTFNGHRTKFYPENLVREKCSDLIEGILYADKNGFFEIDGERYGIIAAWVREFGISKMLAYKQLKEKDYIYGYTLKGKKRKFYRETVVRETFADTIHS